MNQRDGEKDKLGIGDVCVECEIKSSGSIYIDELHNLWFESICKER
jgi:hypothetical protein